MNNYEHIIIQNLPNPRGYPLLDFVGFYIFFVTVVIYGVSFTFPNNFTYHSPPSIDKRGLFNDENSLNFSSSSSSSEEDLENTHNDLKEDNSSNQTFNQDLNLSNKTSNDNVSESNNSSINKKEDLPSFFESIQSKLYKGKWMSTKNIDNFKNTEGAFEIRFYLDNMTYLKYPKMSFKFTVRDGYYFGNYLDFEIIFQTKINPPVNDNVIFNLRSALFELKGSEYFTEKSYYICFMDLDITFSELNKEIVFKKIQGEVFSKQCVINQISFELTETKDNELEKSSRFSIYLLITGLISLYESYIQFKQINLYPTIAAKYSSIFIASNLVWNTYICISSIFASIQYSERNIFYLSSVLVYFFIGAVLQLRTLLIVWKNNNLELLNNYALFRQKVLIFYMIFYVSLVIFLYHSTYIFTHNYLISFFVASLWIPQIIHSVTVGKCVVPLFSIIVISLNRNFVFLYFKLCPENFLNLETYPLYSGITVLIVLLSSVFMILQKIYGARFILPQHMQPQIFDYYKDYDELDNTHSNTENAICSICLFSIAPTTNLNQSETFFKLEEGYVMLKFGKFKDKLRTCCLRLSKKNNKPLMVTPCNHIFHTPCLKAWYEQKQECPICRLALPLMDD